MPPPSLDRMSPAEVYELVAGFLKRIQPEAPPYPGGGGNARKRPLQSPPALSLLPMAAAWGGTPPDDGTGPLPGDPNGPGPEDPDNPNQPGGPFDNAPPIVETPDDPDDPNDPNDPNQPGGPFDDADDKFTELDHDLQVPTFPGTWSAGADDLEDFNYLTRNNGRSVFVFTDTFDQPTVGPWWTQMRGTWSQGSSNGVLNITAIGTGNVPLAVLLYNSENYAGDATIDITLDNVTAGAVKYAIARGADNGSSLLNGYAFRVIGNGSIGNCSIGRIDNGVFTTLGASFGQAYAAGDTFGIRVTGTTIQARRNGAQVNTDRTDATYTTGRLGIGGDSTVPAFRAASLSNT